MFGKRAVDPTAAEARAMAYRYLGRREYSQLELSRKLKQRGVDAVVADALVENLVSDGLVSDQRFAEIFCRQRVGRLFGPLKIRLELQARGVSDELVSMVMQPYESQWHTAALDWVRKRASGDFDQKQKARLYRSGKNRGFSHDQVMRAIEQVQRHC